MKVTKEEILKVAIQMIRSDGLERFSVRKLAEKLNISHNTPYNYFGSKDGLIDAVTQKIRVMLDANNKRKIAQRKDEEPFLVAAEEIFRYLSENKGYASIAFSPRYSGYDPEGGTEIFDRQYGIYRQNAYDYFSRCGVAAEEMEDMYQLVRATLSGLAARMATGSVVLEGELKAFVRQIICETMGLKPVCERNEEA